jgi:hypothetical protein
VAENWGGSLCLHERICADFADVISVLDSNAELRVGVQMAMGFVDRYLVELNNDKLPLSNHLWPPFNWTLVNARNRVSLAADLGALDTVHQELFDTLFAARDRFADCPSAFDASDSVIDELISKLLGPS